MQFFNFTLLVTLATYTSLAAATPMPGKTSSNKSSSGSDVSIKHIQAVETDGKGGIAKTTETRYAKVPQWNPREDEFACYNILCNTSKDCPKKCGDGCHKGICSKTAGPPAPPSPKGKAKAKAK